MKKPVDKNKQILAVLSIIPVESVTAVIPVHLAIKDVNHHHVEVVHVELHVTIVVQRVNAQVDMQDLDMMMTIVVIDKAEGIKAIREFLLLNTNLT